MCLTGFPHQLHQIKNEISIEQGHWIFKTNKCQILHKEKLRNSFLCLFTEWRFSNRSSKKCCLDNFMWSYLGKISVCEMKKRTIQFESWANKCVFCPLFPEHLISYKNNPKLMEKKWLFCLKFWTSFRQHLSWSSPISFFLWEQKNKAENKSCCLRRRVRF